MQGFRFRAVGAQRLRRSRGFRAGSLNGEVRLVRLRVFGLIGLHGSQPTRKFQKRPRLK